MLNQINKIAIFISTLSLIGCATTAEPLKISEDNSPSAAKIRFILSSPDETIKIYPPHDCNGGAVVAHNRKALLLLDSLTDTMPKRAGMIAPPDPKNQMITEYSLKGGQIINIGFQQVFNCAFGRSFYAEQGGQYEVELIGKPPHGCVAKINKLSIDDEKVTRTMPRSVGDVICAPPQNN